MHVAKRVRQRTAVAPRIVIVPDFPLPGALLQGCHPILATQACGMGLRQWSPKVLP